MRGIDACKGREIDRVVDGRVVRMEGVSAQEVIDVLLTDRPRNWPVQVSALVTQHESDGLLKVGPMLPLMVAGHLDDNSVCVCVCVCNSESEMCASYYFYFKREEMAKVRVHKWEVDRAPGKE